MNIGIDFGSTYSILSRYREDHGVLEALQDENSITIPSVLSLNIKKGLIKIGNAAKDQTGMKRFQTYKAFKMLLTEENKKFLKERQYDDEHTPLWATDQFLHELVAKARDIFGESDIQNLVVGAPDVWFHNFSTLSGRALVRDICATIDGVQDVRIVSEPVLASAYFAYNFQKVRKKPFEGNILIVDYGGGTLDLSLTEIKSIDKGSVEIRMLESNGAGENTDHSVGNAGIIYMESLMEHVIRKNTPEEIDTIIGTSDFYTAVNELEKMLIRESSIIKDIFEQIGVDDLDDLEDEVLGECAIRCGKEEYEITYADIVQVYNEIIRPVFDEKMDEMIRWAKENRNIDVYKIQGDKFKIALVGGFGNFYLVRNQMREKFGFTDGIDTREKDIINNKQDCEYAISYGAALVASNVFRICTTAPYSMGIVSRQGDVASTNYMVYYSDEIKLNQPYYLKDSDGEDKIVCLGDNWADEFIIDYGRTNPEKIRFRAKKEFREKLEGLIKNDLKLCKIGISFSNSDVLTLHLCEAIYDRGRMNFEEIEPIELGELKKAFNKN